MSDLLVVLTWLHVFSVVAWVGSFTYLLVVLLPTFGKVKEEGRREFLLKLLPRHESFTLVFATATIVFGPPLIITREELDRGLEVLDRALAVADARVDPATA